MEELQRAKEEKKKKRKSGEWPPKENKKVHRLKDVDENGALIWKDRIIVEILPSNPQTPGVAYKIKDSTGQRNLVSDMLIFPHPEH